MCVLFRERENVRMCLWRENYGGGVNKTREKVGYVMGWSETWPREAGE